MMHSPTKGRLARAFLHPCLAPARCCGWGALLSLAYPNALAVHAAWPGAAWLACVLMIPLLAELWGGSAMKWSRALACGYGFGLGFFVLNVLWLSTVSWLGAILLAVYLAIYPAVFALYAATWARPDQHGDSSEGKSTSAWSWAIRILGRGLIHGFVWGGLELMRAHVLTGFGWNGLAVALPVTSPVVQSADLLGVAGVSALLLAWQSVLAQILWQWRHARAETADSQPKASDHGTSRSPRHWPGWTVACCVMAVLPALAFGYGFLRLRQLSQHETFALRALMIQLNVPQQAGQQLWSAEEIHMGYEDEAEDALNNGQAPPHWLLLPEVALNGRLLTADDGTHAMWRESEETLARLLALGVKDVFVGMVELEAEKSSQGYRQREDPRAWNSLVHVQQDFSLQTARKRHLVMFGEYIPWLDAMPWLRRIYEQQAGAAYSGAFSAGTSIDPVRVSVDGHEVSVIPSICFEDTVAAETRLFYRDETQVIVNLTNDGWFRTSAAAAQHFANASFRCIEMRRPMLRCANSGVTAAISMSGESQVLRDAAGSTFVRGHQLMVLPVPLRSPRSLYAHWGDAPLLVLAVVGFLYPLRRRRASFMAS